MCVNVSKDTGLNYIDVIMVQVLKDFISRIIFQYSMHLIWGPPGDCPDLPFVLARECFINPSYTECI